jgi:hypothetical protein
LAVRGGIAAEFAIDSRFFVELGISGFVPLLRSNLLQLDNDVRTQLWVQPVVGGMGRLGVGMTFP